MKLRSFHVYITALDDLYDHKRPLSKEFETPIYYLSLAQKLAMDIDNFNFEEKNLHNQQIQLTSQKNVMFAIFLQKTK